jgi:hypothetical protein
MNNSLYDQFAASFAAKSLSSLVDSFNCQVGCRGFNSARAAHDRALIDELISRDIDLSAVRSDGGTSFAHHVKLEDNRFVTID